LDDRNQHNKQFRGTYCHPAKLETARPFTTLGSNSSNCTASYPRRLYNHRRENSNSLRPYVCLPLYHRIVKLQHRSQCHMVAVVSTIVRTPRNEMLIIPGSLTWPKNCCVWSSNVGACAVKAMTTATLSYVLSLRKQNLMLFAAGGNEKRFLIVKHCSNQTFLLIHLRVKSLQFLAHRKHPTLVTETNEFMLSGETIPLRSEHHICEDPVGSGGEWVRDWKPQFCIVWVIYSWHYQYF
jgi:hypothetical protein